MKVTLEKLADASPALRELLNIRLGVQMSWMIYELVDAINPELERLDRVREKYDPEKMTAAQKKESEQEMEELLQREITVNVEPIPLSALEGKEISPGVFLSAPWLFSKNDVGGKKKRK